MNVNRLLGILAILLLTTANALYAQKPVKVKGVQGRWQVSDDITLKQAEERAFMEAKKAALQKAGVMENVWSVFGQITQEDVHHGMLGEVVDVDTATVNTLFIVEREGEELLVPAQEEFIRGIDQQQKLITVELPEGLLNLDELEEEE